MVRGGGEVDESWTRSGGGWRKRVSARDLIHMAVDIWIERRRSIVAY